MKHSSQEQKKSRGREQHEFWMKLLLQTEEFKDLKEELL